MGTIHIAGVFQNLHVLLTVMRIYVLEYAREVLPDDPRQAASTRTAPAAM